RQCGGARLGRTRDELLQVGRGGVDARMYAELDLECAPPSVREFNDRINLEPLLIAIVRHRPAHYVCIDAKVADGERFEKESERLRFTKQHRLRCGKRPLGQGWVDEVPLRAHSLSHGRAKM